MKLFFPLILFFLQATANAQLNAAFAVNVQSGCAPLLVQFTDQSTGNPSSWLWDFGNGRTSTLQNPAYAYVAPGIYTIQLTVTNGVNTSTVIKSQFIVTNQNPRASFALSASDVCPPGDVKFTDYSVSDSSTKRWLWDFGDGSNSNEQNPVHTYTKAGTFDVTLTVFDASGCQDSSTRYSAVTAGTISTSSFTYSASNVCGYPSTVNFKNTSSPAPDLTYEWTFGDGAVSTLENPVYTYNFPGYYKVELETTSTTDVTCKHTSVHFISVAPPVADFILPESFCANTSLKFKDNSAPQPQKVSWDFGDSSKASGQDVNHVFQQPGTYTISQTAEFGACNAINSKTIVVGAKPAIAFTATGNTTSCNNNETINFTNQTAGAQSYTWIFGDGVTFDGTTASHTYTESGSYNVSLAAKTTVGCIDTLTKTSLIRLSSFAISNISPLQVSGCVPASVSFSAKSVNGEFITDYNWAFGDGGTSASPNPTHNYLQPGGYTISLIAANAQGCTDTLIYASGVALGVSPQADFTVDSTEACASSTLSFKDLSKGAVTGWLWDFGDKSTSIDRNPNHQYNGTGYFDVKLTTYSYGCADSISKHHFLRIKPPIAKFEIESECRDNFTFNFINTSKSPELSAWDFGDGFTSQSASPSHTYKDTGTYTVKLNVANSDCSYSTSAPIYVYDKPDDILHDPEKADYCKYDVINFYINNYNRNYISQYNWIFGDGLQTGFLKKNDYISQTYQYLAAGNYEDSLIITNIYGCNDTATDITSMHISGPSASFITDSLNLCVGTATMFTDLTQSSESPVQKWLWIFGDGAQDSTAKGSTAHVYNDTGFYTTQLKVTDAKGCRDSLIRYYGLHIQSITLGLSNDTALCAGEAATLYATGGDSYTWTPASGLDCPACDTVLASPAATTTYYVRAIKTGGCAATDSIKVSIQPPVVVSINGPDSTCAGVPVTLSASGADGYKWLPLFPAGAPVLNGSPVTLTADTITSYSVIGFDSLGCSSDTTLLRLKVNPIPQIIFLHDEVEILSGGSYNLFPMYSPDVTHVTWSPDTAISCINCRYPVVNPVQDFTYTATATNPGNCSSQKGVTVKVLCNKNNLFVPNTFSPNGDGVNDRFNVMGNGLLTIKSFKVYNRWGQVIYNEEDVRPNSNQFGWNGRYRGDLQPTGVYIYVIEVQCENEQSVSVKGNITLLR